MKPAKSVASEFELIDTIRKIAGDTRKKVVMGIGDDCAALAHDSGELSLHTTDCLVEGVHFRRAGRTAFDIGWKALASNLSDIAAMGGVPVCFLLSLIVPAGEDSGFLFEMVRGAVESARIYGAVLAGGNISSAGSGVLTIDVTMIGKIDKNHVARRSGSRKGDSIIVAGWPGLSSAGLHLMEQPSRIRMAGPALKRLIQAHLRPVPMIELGSLLAKKNLVSSMIDISDGLMQDLGHICRESKTGAEVDAKAIPLHPDLKCFAKLAGKNPLSAALAGGEDYILLFTAATENVFQIENISKKLGIKTTVIGTVTRRKGVVLLNAPTDIETSGYDHLKVSLNLKTPQQSVDQRSKSGAHERPHNRHP